MAAVIENHQGMLSSLLNTIYNKKLLSSKEGRKIIDCKGRHSIAVIQMKSLAYLSHCGGLHLQPFPIKLLMGVWRLFDKRLKDSYSEQNKFQWHSEKQVLMNKTLRWWSTKVYRWFGHAAHVDWFEWHSPVWVKKNKTIIGFKKEISCQEIYK